MSAPWAVVPAKGFARAKQRLAPVLDEVERAALARAMLCDVLAALRGARSIAGTLVVTADAEVASLAREAGAEVLDDRRNGGQSAAVEQAIAWLRDAGGTTLLTVPGDVPLLAASDVDSLVAAHPEGRAVTLVPALGEGGTNAVMCSPPDALPLHFGYDSLRQHIDAARASGAEPTLFRCDNLALDIDRPDDLERFVATPSATRAYRELVTRGIVDRVGVAAARATER